MLSPVKRQCQDIFHKHFACRVWSLFQVLLPAKLTFTHSVMTFSFLCSAQNLFHLESALGGACVVARRFLLLLLRSLMD